MRYEACLWKNVLRSQIHWNGKCDADNYTECSSSNVGVIPPTKILYVLPE
jgi:hypothetical protein